MRALIFAGAIVSVILNNSRADAQTNSTAVSGKDALSKEAAAGNADTKDKTFNLNAVSKAIVGEASRLEKDAAAWNQKVQQLELDFNRSQDDEATAKNVNESLLVLQAAADRLGPDAEARVTFRKQEGALRELASRAEVHSLPEIRKTANYFQQKTTELHALTRSIEETRMGLMTQIDLLQELKVQLEFNRAAKQIDELLKHGEVSLNSIQVIAAHAQQLANDLAGFGSTPAAAAQSAYEATAAQAAKTPAPVAKPAAAYGRTSGRTAADAPGLAAVPAGNALRAETAPAASARATQVGPPNTKETATGFILLPSRSPSIDSAHRMVAPSSPKPAAPNPPPTPRGVTVAPDGRL